MRTCLILIFLFLSSVVQASPAALTYQGRILKSDGAPLEYGNVAFIFQITNPSGSCVLYQEQFTGYNMIGSKGVFDVSIGSGTVSWPTSGGTGVLDAFNNSSNFSCGACTGYTCVAGSGSYNPMADHGRVLKVQFHDGNGWKTISPNTEIRSVPFAGYSLSAQKLGQHDADSFILKNEVNSNTSCGGGGQFLTWNASTKTFGCSGVSGSNGGTVTTVTASTPLTVSAGTESSTPHITMQVASSSQNGYLSSTDWTSFNNKIGPATIFAGDISGTAANISVDKIKGVAVSVSSVASGDVLKFSGGHWVNGSISTSDIAGLSTSLGGKPDYSQFPTTCTAAQTLTFVSPVGGFTCTNIAIPGSQVSGNIAGTAAGFTGSLGGDVTGTQTATVVGKLQGVGVSATAPTNNQVLKYNGSQWAPATLASSDLPSGTLSGSGTAGYLSYYTAAHTLADSLIYQSSGNVGLGTSNPSEKLDVVGKVKANEFCIGSACINSWPSSGGAGTVTNIATGTGLTGGPITTNGTISIADGGVGPTQLVTISGLMAGTYGNATTIPSITVDTKGRVTAITTNTVAALPAASGASGKFLKSDGSSWSGQDIRFSDIKNISGTSAFNIGACGSNQTVAWSSLTDSFSCQMIGNLDADKITTGTLDAARLPSSVTSALWGESNGNVYRNSGNVGIGTSSPSYNLDISGTANASQLCIAGDCRSSWPTGSGSSSSPVVAFHVHKNGVNQTVTNTVYTKVTWPTEVFDTNNNFANSRFTPTVPGKYIINLGIACNGSTNCYGAIYKNGSIFVNGHGPVYSQVNAIVDMNGTTDYIEAYVQNTGGTSFWADSNYTYFMGMLLSSNVGGTNSVGTTQLQNNSVTLDKIDFSSTSKGLGLPSMTTTQMNAISSPTAGMMVFNTTTGKTYVYTGSSWNEMGASGGFTLESWQAPTLQNGWVNYDNVYNPAGYYKDPFGKVHLRGLVKSGTTGGVICMFTLPAGYRPGYRELFDQISANTQGRVDVLADGCVTANIGGAWVSLDGISFQSATGGAFAGNANPWAVNGQNTSYTNGNVGVGATAPTSRLEVVSNSTDTGHTLKIDSGGDSTGEHALYVLGRHNSQFQGDVIRAAVNRTASTGFNLINTVIDEDGTPSYPFVVRGDGNVGIGTSNPSYGLDARSATFASGGVAQANPSASTAVPTTTWTKVSMNNVEYDTDAILDAANGRIKPTRAGYYRVTVNLKHTMTTGSTGHTLLTGLYKNGASYKDIAQLINYNGGAFSQTIQLNAIVPLNGTTDYLEAFAYTNYGSSTIAAAGSWITVEFVRSL